MIALIDCNNANSILRLDESIQNSPKINYILFIFELKKLLLSETKTLTLARRVALK